MDRVAAFAGIVLAVLGVTVGAIGHALWSGAGSMSTCHIPIVLSSYRVGDRTIHTVQKVREGPYATDEITYELRLEEVPATIEGSFAGARGGDGNVTYEDRTPPIDRLDRQDRLVHEDPTTESRLVIRDAVGRLLSGYGCR